MQQRGRAGKFFFYLLIMINHYENVIKHKKDTCIKKKLLCRMMDIHHCRLKSLTGVSYVSRNDSSPAGLLMGVACVHR